MAGREREYEALHDRDPWEDSDWLPASADILLPTDNLSHLFLETPLSAITIDDPVRIAPDDSMRLALFRMHQRHVRALLVMEGERLAGIVTDRDAVKHLDAGDPGDRLLVREVMTPNPVVVHVDDPVGLAAHRLCLDGVHHLPVVDGERVVGIVALGRVLHAVIAAITAD